MCNCVFAPNVCIKSIDCAKVCRCGVTVYLGTAPSRLESINTADRTRKHPRTESTHARRCGLHDSMRFRSRITQAHLDHSDLVSIEFVLKRALNCVASAKRTRPAQVEPNQMMARICVCQCYLVRSHHCSACLADKRARALLHIGWRIHDQFNFQ